MSESKSKIMSFRLPAELEALASAAAAAAGDKNASAWCQKLAIEALSKIAEPDENENVEQSLAPATVADLLKALGNLRQLNLDCFEISFKDEEQYKKFLKVVIASEEEWEGISQSAGKPKFENLRLTSEPVAATASLDNPPSLSEKDEVSVVQTAAVISDEYQLFIEDMKDDVAGVLGGKLELSCFKAVKAVKFGESATKNQVPVSSPILGAAGQTDNGKSF